MEQDKIKIGDLVKVLSYDDIDAFSGSIGYVIEDPTASLNKFYRVFLFGKSIYDSKDFLFYDYEIVKVE